MTRRALFLITPEIRARAAEWCHTSPHDTRVEFKEPKRTPPQNALMWVLLTELSRQLEWHGQTLSPEDWKLIMLDGLKRELRVVPAIDGRGMVMLGRSSSDLSKDEMGQLIELIYAFGAQNGVEFGDRP